jgi:type VI secretion system protein ImpE
MVSLNSKELIRAGKLSEVRKQLAETVKSAPSDRSSRTLLFQVLSFCGEWDKAERQLDVIVAQDPESETGVQVYKNLVHAEKERREVLNRNRPPSFLTGTPHYLDLYFTAWDKLNKKEIEEAHTIYSHINSQCPKISGTMDGKAFCGLRDIDAFLSLFLETVVHDRYIWIPFDALRELSISPPQNLFDLIWATAQIITWEGLSINCYLPVLYPGTSLHEDDLVRLGRMTDWMPLGGAFSQGLGQHVYQIGDEEITILEIREARFKIPIQEKRDEKSN